MKIKKIKVPYYKHTIISTIADSKDSGEEILKLMKRHHIPAEHIESVKAEFDGGANGGAEIFYNDGALLIFIVTYPHKNACLLVSTLVHEGRHAADRIINNTGLEGPEAAAYLEQYIIMELIKDYIKDEAYTV